MSNPADTFHFEGFDQPTYTQVPDQFFDVLMTKLSEAELRVLLYIMRHTFGYKKDADPISFNQFLHGIVRKDGTVVDEGSGLKSPTHLSKALKSLEEKGIVEVRRSEDRHRNKQTTIYALRFRRGVVRQGYHPTTRSVVGVLPQAYIQDTTIQETTKQYSNHSKDTVPENDPRPPDTGADVPPVAEPQRPSNGQPTSIKEILAGKPPPRPRSPRKRLPNPQYLATVIRELSAELHDEEHVASNLAQARNLMMRTGLSESALVARVYEARSITKQQGGIVKPAGNGLRNKMPYCFAVLRDLLGLDQERPAPSGLSDDDLDASLDVRPIDPPTGGSG